MELNGEQRSENQAKQDVKSMGVVSLDDKGNIKVFYGNTMLVSSYNIYEQKFQSSKEFPTYARNKDLFSFGFPYFIQKHKKHIAFTCDYGVVLIKIWNV